MASRALVVIVGSALVACTSARPAAQDEHAGHAMATGGAGSATQAGTPGIPASGMTAAARLAASPRHAEWVKVAYEPGSPDTVMAFMVYPVTQRKAPVVVVIHENTGLTTWVRGVADQLAADGFIAVAPDLLSKVRGGPSTQELPRDSVGKIIGGVDAASRNKAIAAVASYAMTQPSAEPRYAVIGYCWGGGTTFMHAVHGGVKGFSGGVSFYGGFPYQHRGQAATATTAATPATLIVDSIAKIRVPVMLLNGSKDMRIGAMMPALDSTMKALKKDYAGTNYSGAIHGFMRAQDDRRATRENEADSVVTAEQRDNLAAAKDAWPKTIAFLKKHLGAR